MLLGGFWGNLVCYLEGFGGILFVTWRAFGGNLEFGRSHGRFIGAETSLSGFLEVSQQLFEP